MIIASAPEGTNGEDMGAAGVRDPKQEREGTEVYLKLLDKHNR
jgi:hypothetical protein